MKRTALLIDGGYLRETAQAAGIFCEPDFIEDFAHSCFNKEVEDPYRILYYDCKLYRGDQKYPISGRPLVMNSSSEWLKTLARKQLFAVRLGEMQWRGWKLKQDTIKELSVHDRELTDYDFEWDISQKGVDMKIGLDIAVLADNEVVCNLVIVTADNDIIPAIKHGRKQGMQIILAVLPNEAKNRNMDQLREHADFIRDIKKWPEKFTPYRPKVRE